jgi:hypothetical protein
MLLIGLMAAAPASAQDARRRRAPEQRGQQAQSQEERRDSRRTRERAVPRGSARQNEAQRPPEIRRQDRARAQNDVRRTDQGRRGNDTRRYDVPRRGAGRAYYPYYSNRGYGSRTIIVPRIVRPTVVRVVPYRPYRYRPSIGIGIYYGSGGSYPYGYTPRGYYDPIPGRPYGGLRITGASRDAQVFADGYYVGIVDDFDGIFQHVNLEAGPHRIEIVEPGYEGIEFDVMVQPGRTTTFRADRYRY